MKSKNRKRINFHVLSWSLFLLILILSAEDQYGPGIESIELFKHSIPITGFMALSSYFSLFIHTRFFEQRKYLLFGISFTGASVLWSFLFVQTIFQLIGGQRHSGYVQNYINFLSVSVFAIALRYAKRGIVNQFFCRKRKLNYWKPN